MLRAAFIIMPAAIYAPIGYVGLGLGPTLWACGVMLVVMGIVTGL